MKARYITDANDIPQLTISERNAISKVTEQFDFRTTDYYLSLIDWSNPADPIRRLIIPSTDELNTFGKMDPSDEHAYTILPGLEHKYNSTALLLTSDVCAGICRYCFRKRLFMRQGEHVLKNIPAALDYIRLHPEITNILLTGGDPFMLSTHKIDAILSGLRAIQHVQIIRIGTRMPVFNPYRILDDPELLLTLSRHSTPNKKVYVMNHFSHPRELTGASIHALDQLNRAGAILTNQCPLIRGVNDDPAVLAELWRQLSFIGAVPYYLFQCRPAVGNHAYIVPIEQGYMIVEQARSMVSGLAKRLRYVMSHTTGKIEIIGLTDREVYLKYHRAANDIDSGRFMVFKRNPEACWLEDYEEMVQNCPIQIPDRLNNFE